MPFQKLEPRLIILLITKHEVVHFQPKGFKLALLVASLIHPNKVPKILIQDFVHFPELGFIGGSTEIFIIHHAVIIIHGRQRGNSHHTLSTWPGITGSCKAAVSWLSASRSTTSRSFTSMSSAYRLSLSRLSTSRLSTSGTRSEASKLTFMSLDKRPLAVIVI